MSAPLYLLKTTCCKDCGTGLEYKTAKPLRCKTCRLRESSRRASLYGKANRAAIRLKELERRHAKAAAEGREIRDFSWHSDQSAEAKKERQAEACRRYRERNPEKRRASANKWAKENRQAALERFRERYRTDPAFNLAIKVRRRIHMALRNGYRGVRRTDRVIDMLGCSYDELKAHIEKQFTKGMAWDQCFNGEIHLDHIRPCAQFDLSDADAQRECFHFTNLRPLWAKDNIRKSAKRTHLI